MDKQVGPRRPSYEYTMQEGLLGPISTNKKRQPRLPFFIQLLNRKIILRHA
jgi:hypothetical protein